MGFLGEISEYELQANGAEVTASPGYGQYSRRGKVFQQAGDEAPPLPGDVGAFFEVPGTRDYVLTGVADLDNQGEAQPGERRVFARDPENREPVAWLHLFRDGRAVIERTEGTAIRLETDGSVELESAGTTLTVRADGEVRANGARITSEGDFITALGVSLNEQAGP